MPKLALSPVREPNSPILIVSWENTEPATARMTPKIRRNRRFIISAGLLTISQKTARAFGVHRSPFTVQRSPFTVHRSPFTVHRSPFTVHRSPFTVHRSPFTVHRSPFTVHPSPAQSGH